VGVDEADAAQIMVDFHDPECFTNQMFPQDAGRQILILYFRTEHTWKVLSIVKNHHVIPVFAIQFNILPKVIFLQHRFLSHSVPLGVPLRHFSLFMLLHYSFLEPR
jgi:hypothetical protein